MNLSTSLLYNLFISVISNVIMTIINAPIILIISGGKSKDINNVNKYIIIMR